jgi:hypothetical protein
MPRRRRDNKLKFQEIPVPWEVAVLVSRAHYPASEIRQKGTVIAKDDPQSGRGMVDVRLDDDRVVQVRGSDLIAWGDWEESERRRIDYEAEVEARRQKLAAEQRQREIEWEAGREAREAQMARILHVNKTNDRLRQQMLDEIGLRLAHEGIDAEIAGCEYHDGSYVLEPEQLAHLLGIDVPQYTSYEPQG